MESLYSFILTAVSLIIDLTTWLVALAAIYLAGKAIFVMISNRSLHLANLLLVPILLGVLALLLQILPELYLRSARVGLERGRPESVLLREELRLWIPSGWATPGITVGAITVEDPLLATATPDQEVGGGVPPPEATQPIVAITAAPVVTQTPAIVVITATPVPTATPQPTIDTALWNPQTPPPTPPVGGG